MDRELRIAIIGCGGSGRSMAAALHEVDADVTLVNRSQERGSVAARMLDLPFIPLCQFSLRGYSMLVNATPVGRNGETLPIDLSEMAQDSVIVDLTYTQKTTQLMQQATALGFIAIDGWNILVSQVRHQYQLMTGELMPEDLARNVLGISPAPPRNHCVPETATKMH